MKKFLSKFIACVIVLSIAMLNINPAFAAFGPSNNQAGAQCSYVGEVTVPTEIYPSVEVGNKLIVTLPNADLSGVVAGDIYNKNERLFITDVTADNEAKIVTFTFPNPLEEGEVLTFSFYDATSPVGTHPYKIELYSGATDTTIELESGTYDVLDNGVTIKLTVGNFLHFGLDMNTSDPMDVKLQYLGGRAVVEHRIPWTIATNAESYTISARLRTEIKSGEHAFPYSIPDGMDYISAEDIEHVTGVFIGNFAIEDSRANNMLKGYYTPITTTTDIILTTGSLTNGDHDEVKIVFAADGKTRAGVYQGVIEFTVTPTF